jgi:predicted phosphoadenosine phosphosulfate sulfurtransferase
LKTLKEKPYVFLPSDKGGEFCVIEKEKYDELAMTHLNNTNTYEAVNNLSVQRIEKVLNNTWKRIAAKLDIPMKIVRSYVTKYSNYVKFYHLIKTHKDDADLKIRPIVSIKNSPTEKLSCIDTMP